MKIFKQRQHAEDVYKYANLQEEDVILYMGGRIDDNNLYPEEYREFLNAKIQNLKPTKIICHNHWYAKKYYQSGILPNDTKIDIIFTYYNYAKSGNIQAINPDEYRDYREWMKILTEKNRSIVYGLYISEGSKPSKVDIDDSWFANNYNIDNVKYFTFNRGYTPHGLGAANLGHGSHTRNASDRFGCLRDLVKAGYKNINIIGFSAFGSNESMDYHSLYKCGGDKRFLNRKLFDLKTSEDLKAESDIMKYWVQTKTINNLEDHDELISHIYRVNKKDNK